MWLLCRLVNAAVNMTRRDRNSAVTSLKVVLSFQKTFIHLSNSCLIPVSVQIIILLGYESWSLSYSSDRPNWRWKVTVVIILHGCYSYRPFPCYITTQFFQLVFIGRFDTNVVWCNFNKCILSFGIKIAVLWRINGCADRLSWTQNLGCHYLSW